MARQRSAQLRQLHRLARDYGKRPHEVVELQAGTWAALAFDAACAVAARQALPNDLALLTQGSPIPPVFVISVTDL